MRKPLAGAVILYWIACGPGPAAQPPTPQVFAGAPAAPWIFPPGAAGNEFGVFHFRRVFELNARPSSFVVHVSADNRYRLFVNGEQVSSGPQRSDLMHWRYETVDLAPQLRAGRNVLAALVWNWGAERPVAQFSRQTAFLLQGDSAREAVVNSGLEWKVLRNTGYAPIPVRADAVGGYYASPPGEAIDARQYPWGWTQLDFPEEGWVAAAAGEGFRARRTQLRASNPFGEAGGWQLVARSIPPMEESPVRFATVRRSDDIVPDGGFLRGTSDLVVPARSGQRSCWTRDTSPMRSPCSRRVAVRAAQSGSFTPRHSRTQRGTRATATRSMARRSPAYVTSSGPTVGSAAASRRSGSAPTASCSSRSRRETRLSAYTTCTASSWAIRSRASPGSTATSPGSRTCGRSTGVARGSAPGRPISTPRTTSSSSTWATHASRH